MDGFVAVPHEPEFLTRHTGGSGRGEQRGDYRKNEADSAHELVDGTAAK